MQFKVIPLMLYWAVHISGGYSQCFEKIVNGQTTQPGQFPHQVSMQQGSSHFCGGSIIDETHILTAAHCVIDENHRVFRPESLRIVTGVIDYRAANYQNTFPVAMIIPHQNYNPMALINDIAIVKLARPIPFNSLQKPIRLPTRDTFPGTVAVASGWGAVWGDRPETAGPLPKYLQQLGMIAVGRGECIRMHGNQIFPGQLCAARSRGTGICFGDSGGPLISNGEIIGIASFVKGGCATQFPDVFTRVYHYLPWIHEVLKRY